MKKLLSIVLAILMLASVSTVAFADGYDETYKENGFTIHFTDKFGNTDGVFNPYAAGYDYESGIGVVAFGYYAMPQEEADVLFNKNDNEWTDAEWAYFQASQGELAEVVSLNGGRGLADLMELGAEMEVSEDWFTEVGKAGDVTFNAMMIPAEGYLAGIDPAYQEEFITLREELLEVLKNGEYFEPVVKGADLIGTTMHFETTDVDGNPVKSEDIFKENEITMVNIWATWCDPCKGELAGLNEMNARLAENNVAVIGICLDADTELDTCRSLIRENGVEYLNLLPFDGMMEALELTAFPTSYFVSREGTILRLPFEGAPMEMSAYEEVINSLLEKKNVPLGETASVQGSEENLCRVTVSDADGNAVEGAMVQFCSDDACVLGKTDAEGVASFEAEEGITYTIHILKVPEGYEKTDDEFTVAGTDSEVHVVLQRA